MTPSDTATASNEELLRKVIEAQVKGGCDTYETTFDIVNMEINEDAEVIFSNKGMTAFGASVVQRHVLQILLDTDGLKAAYGEQIYASWPKGTLYPNSDEYQITRSKNASNRIIDAWH